jgi:hypothetical protein
LAGGVVNAQLLNPSFKGTILHGSDDYRLLNYGLKYEGQMAVFMKQKLYSEFNGLSIYKNNFISRTSYSTMERLIESGIPQYFHDFVFKFILDLRTSDGSSDAKAFTLDDLSFGFTIWLYACTISSGVFVAEILVFYTKFIAIKIVRELSGLFCFLALLNERIRFFY